MCVRAWLPAAPPPSPRPPPRHPANRRQGARGPRSAAASVSRELPPGPARHGLREEQEVEGGRPLAFGSQQPQPPWHPIARYERGQRHGPRARGRAGLGRAVTGKRPPDGLRRPGAPGLGRRAPRGGAERRRGCPGACAERPPQVCPAKGRPGPSVSERAEGGACRPRDLPEDARLRSERARRRFGCGLLRPWLQAPCLVREVTFTSQGAGTPGAGGRTPEQRSLSAEGQLGPL